MMTGYPHTHIYIDADLWCISIGMSRHTIGKQVFRFLQSSAVYLLSNLMWLSSFIISLCIYIYTCVWVCVCVCYTCHAPRYLGLCAQLQQAQQPERFLQCFFHADDSAVGPECRCLGPTVCHGNRKSCFEEGKFHGIPISQDLPIKKKPIFLSECSDDIPIGKWQGRVILQGTVELWGKPGKLHQNFGGKILYQKCIIMHLCISWGYGGCITSITNPHWWPLVDLAAGVTIADWAKEFDVQSPICVQKFEKGNKWMNIWMPWIYRWMDG